MKCARLFSFKADPFHCQTIASEDLAEDLGVSRASLRKWVQQAKVAAGAGPLGALHTEEREERRRLRRENKALLMERERVKKAAAFVASEALSPAGASLTRAMIRTCGWSSAG